MQKSTHQIFAREKRTVITSFGAIDEISGSREQIATVGACADQRQTKDNI